MAMLPMVRPGFLRVRQQDNVRTQTYWAMDDSSSGFLVPPPTIPEHGVITAGGSRRLRAAPKGPALVATITLDSRKPRNVVFAPRSIHAELCLAWYGIDWHVAEKAGKGSHARRAFTFMLAQKRADPHLAGNSRFQEVLWFEFSKFIERSLLRLISKKGGTVDANIIFLVRRRSVDMALSVFALATGLAAIASRHLTAAAIVASPDFRLWTRARGGTTTNYAQGSKTAAVNNRDWASRIKKVMVEVAVKSLDTNLAYEDPIDNSDQSAVGGAAQFAHVLNILGYDAVAPTLPSDHRFDKRKILGISESSTESDGKDALTITRSLSSEWNKVLEAFSSKSKTDAKSIMKQMLNNFAENFYKEMSATEVLLYQKCLENAHGCGPLALACAGKSAEEFTRLLAGTHDIKFTDADPDKEDDRKLASGRLLVEGALFLANKIEFESYKSKRTETAARAAP